MVEETCINITNKILGSTTHDARTRILVRNEECGMLSEEIIDIRAEYASLPSPPDLLSGILVTVGGR